MRLLNHILLVVVAVTIAIGCKTPNRFEQNIAAGRNIVLEIRVYSQDALDSFPSKLDDLVAEKLFKTLPRCLCEDGRLRDFVYVAGLAPADGSEMVILATPPEMDSKSAIIFHANSRAEIVTKECAVLEIEKSREFAARRNRKVQKDFPPTRYGWCRIHRSASTARMTSLDRDVRRDAYKLAATVAADFSA